MRACQGIAQTGGVVAAASLALVSKGYGEALRYQLNDHIPAGGSGYYDLDGDGDEDVGFDTMDNLLGPRMWAEMYSYGGGNYVSCFIIVGGSDDVVAHDPDVFINNMEPLSGAVSGYLTEFYAQPSPRYAGFFFYDAADSSLHQAWIELEVTGTPEDGQGLDVIAYGYETDPLVGILTGQPEEPSAIKESADLEEFALYQNVPNPFNPTTAIHYDVPEAGGKVTLRIYDVTGRLVRTLADGMETSGKKLASIRQKIDA